MLGCFRRGALAGWGAKVTWTEGPWAATDPMTKMQPLTCAVCHDPHDAKNTGQLRYPVWAYVVEKLAPFYWIRLAGGTLFLAGVVLMAINFIISARAERATTPATGDALPARA